MNHEILKHIITRYDTDREVITEGKPQSLDSENWNFDYIFPRLERAAANQIVDGGATISRYAIWAGTIHDLINYCLEELNNKPNTEKACQLLTIATNSIKAFYDIQVICDPFEGLKVPQYLQKKVVDQDQIKFTNAFFVKLGKEGMWEKSSIEESKIRIGWKSQNIKDINHKKWEKIRRELGSEIANKGSATKDFNALRNICESNQKDIWITFYASKLWWTRVGEETIYEDVISKYRKISAPWSHCDINGNELLINNLPGSLTKTQGFRGTVCKVDDQGTLKRIINDSPSKIFNSIASTLDSLQISIEKAIKQLHWKDFETFVDLIFRGSGWRRISMLGEAMKFADIELEDPITHDKYQVQIKSTSTLKEFNTYVQQFSSEDYRKLFYVVHSPDENLSIHNDFPEYIGLIQTAELAKLSIDLGLTSWLLQRVK